MNNSGGLQKPEGLITRHLRQVAFSRIFFGSGGESKAPGTSETELSVTVVRLKAVSSRHLEVHSRYHGGLRYTS